MLHSVKRPWCLPTDHSKAVHLLQASLVCMSLTLTVLLFWLSLSLLVPHLVIWCLEKAASGMFNLISVFFYEYLQHKMSRDSGKRELWTSHRINLSCAYLAPKRVYVLFFGCSFPLVCSLLFLLGFGKGCGL